MGCRAVLDDSGDNKGSSMTVIAYAMALKMHYWVEKCPGLAASPLVQSGPPRSAKMNREERCEEERLKSNVSSLDVAWRGAELSKCY